MYKYKFVESMKGTEREINETMENNKETDGEESQRQTRGIPRDRQSDIQRQTDEYLETDRRISRDRQIEIQRQTNGDLETDREIYRDRQNYLETVRSRYRRGEI